ncbi:MAG: diguanylate cyclase [Chromatiales bacterium]|jgi:diguanylate cyclase (GGDEF)-like protein
MLRFISALLLLSASFCVFAETINIGVRAHRGLDDALQHWTPTAEYLNSNIEGMQFRILPFASIKDMEQAVANRQLDFFITQPVAYVDLEVMYGASRLLTLVKKGGLQQFSSVIFTRADNADIFSIADLRDRNFAAVAPKGFGGWLMAKREIKLNGLDPDRDLKQVRFLQFQQTVVEAVMNGSTEAGTVRTGIIDEFIKRGRFKQSDIRVLNPKTREGFPYVFSTELYPEWVFAKTEQGSQQLAERITRVLLAMPANHEVARQGDYERWTTALSYQDVHDLMRELRVGSYADYEQDSVISLVERYLHYIVLVILVLLLHSYYALRTRFLNAELQSEIEQKTNLQEQMRQMATRDQLTGLPNRRLVLEILSRELKQSQRSGRLLAMLHIDLDGFKPVNDRLGHEQGDVVLREIADVLVRVIRGNDLAGRIGGDEFLVLLGDIHRAEDAGVVASKLIKQIESHRGLLPGDLDLTASIGVLVFKGLDNISTTSILSMADTLMQQAKQSGNGQYLIRDLTDSGLRSVQ